MPNLNDVTEECLSCDEYIEQMKPVYRGSFSRQKENYKLDEKAVDELKSFKDDYEIIVMFADWCGDARRAVPVLALLEDELDIRIRAFGGMTKPPRGSKEHWAVPPSPIEVKTFDITSSPTIIIFEKGSGKEIGRIKTYARMTGKIETEILKIIKDNQP